MANYGIPFMGSKDKLIHKLAAIFPAADNFYDLFGGGFSVSHFMVLHHSERYKHFLYNETGSGISQFIQDAIAGKYSYDVFKPKWISREDFFKNKDQCAYTRIIWSFGNNQKSYLFGKEIERQKRSLHQAVVFDEFDDLSKEILGVSSFPKHLSLRGRRLYCRGLILDRKGEIVQLEQLQQLERLQRLQQLERLEQLQQLEFSSKSYDDVHILPNSVIYCDPPYKGTAEYVTPFDHDKFWAWVMAQDEPVFVSEYQAPKEARVLAAFRHKKKQSGIAPTDSIEKLFGNDAAFRRLSQARRS